MDSKRVTTAVAGTIIKIAIAAFVIYFVYNTAVGAYDYGFRVFAEPPMEEAPGTVVNVVIADGTSSTEVGKLLVEKKLVRDAKLFNVQEVLSEYKDKIRPGAYELNTSMTAEEILAVIAAEPETVEGGNAGESLKDTVDEAETGTGEPETISGEAGTTE